MAGRKKVKILIETDGFFDGTRIYVDGEEWLVKEVNFSASVPHRVNGHWKGGRCNLQVQREIDGKVYPMKFYAGDFEKLAEASELNGKEQDDGEDPDERGTGS